jgi:hypothetical protein
MKYVVEMTSDAMMYIPSFVMIGSDIQAVVFMGDIHAETQIHRPLGDFISLLLFFLAFFRKSESRLLRSLCYLCVYVCACVCVCVSFLSTFECLNQSL